MRSLPDFDEVTFISLKDILTEGTTTEKNFLQEDIHEMKYLDAFFGNDMNNLRVDPQVQYIERCRKVNKSGVYQLFMLNVLEIMLKRTVEALCLSKMFYAMEIYNNTA